MNLADLLDHFRIPYRRAGQSPHVTGDWYGLVCPWCDFGKGNFGLGIKPGRRFASCWVCGSHSLAEVIQKYTDAPWKEILGKLDNLSYLPIAAPRPQGTLKLPKGVGPLQPVHRKYLRGRKYDPDHIEQFWHVGGIGLASRLAWRLFIPIELEGKTVSWTTRAVGDVPHSQRYRTAKPEEEAIPAKSLLYGGDHVRHAVIVTEGPTSAWRLGPGAVATLGVGYTLAQLELLSRFPIRAICFDHELKAQKRAQQLCNDLAVFDGETYIVNLDSADPGTASRKEVRVLRRTIFKE